MRELPASRWVWQLGNMQRRRQAKPQTRLGVSKSRITDKVLLLHLSPTHCTAQFASCPLVLLYAIVSVAPFF